MILVNILFISNSEKIFKAVKNYEKEFRFEGDREATMHLIYATHHIEFPDWDIDWIKKSFKSALKKYGFQSGMVTFVEMERYEIINHAEKIWLYKESSRQSVGEEMDGFYKRIKSGNENNEEGVVSTFHETVHETVRETVGRRKRNIRFNNEERKKGNY